VNDHQIGDMIRLAIDNVDCVSGFSFQPVCFTGRINRRELESKRFTQSDLAHAVADQTGLTDKYEDWFPLSCISPFSKLLSNLQNYERPNLTSHPHCAMGRTSTFTPTEEGHSHHALLRYARHAARNRPARPASPGSTI